MVRAVLNNFTLLLSERRYALACARECTCFYPLLPSVQVLAPLLMVFFADEIYVIFVVLFLPLRVLCSLVGGGVIGLIFDVIFA